MSQRDFRDRGREGSPPGENITLADTGTRRPKSARWLKEDTMRRTAWIAVLALAGLGSLSCNNALEGKEAFQADLTSANEVPARPTAANGTAQIFIEGDSISYAIEVDDITAITAAHIHTGAPGVNGPVRLFLYPPRAGDPAAQVTTTDKRILVQATVPSSNINGVTFEELKSAMRNNGAYVNVHTVQFGGGEMRGTIRPLNLD